MQVVKIDGSATYTWFQNATGVALRPVPARPVPLASESIHVLLKITSPC
jgi:hypothetical protein